jgi:hypothetical protein
MPDKSSGKQLPTEKIVCALITAITTVAVAFIGIVPQMREKDRAAISDLQAELAKVKQQLSQGAEPIPIKKCNVGGAIKTTDGAPLANAEVYLIEASGSENMAITGDDGSFAFQKVEDVPYWIVVRHSASKKSARTLMKSDPQSGIIQIPELIVEYQRQR